MTTETATHPQLWPPGQISGGFTNSAAWTKPVPTRMALLAAGALTASCLFAAPRTHIVAYILSDTTSDGRVFVPQAAERDTSAASSEPAEVVRSLKRRSGLTWDQLASALGVSRRSVHGWAAGTKVSARNMEALTDLDHLLALSEVPGDPESTRVAVLRSLRQRKVAPSPRIRPTGPGPLDLVQAGNESDAWPDIDATPIEDVTYE